MIFVDNQGSRDGKSVSACCLMSIVVPAEVGEAASLTLRPSGDADGAAVVDEAMAELVALFRGDNCAKSLFNFGRLLDVIHESDEIRETDAVGIGDDGGLAVDITENQIGTLASDAGEREELLHGIRHDVVILLVEYRHAGMDVAGFRFAKAAGADNRFNRFGRGFSKGSNGRKRLQKVNHDDVDSGIGALGGEPHADEKLPGILIIQRTLGGRIFIFEPFDDGKGELTFSHR